MKEGNNFTFFTKDTRFNVDKLLQKNIVKYFDNFIQDYVQGNTKVLDYGCGPGTFSIKLSKMTRNEVHGVDISEAFIDQCNYIKNNLNIKNFYPQHVKNNTFHLMIILLI